MFIFTFFVKIFKLIRWVFGLIRRFFRLISAILILVCLGALGLAAYANFAVNSHSGKIYDRVEDLPRSETALLLGCAEKTSEGLENKYFRARINAAAQLYHTGKVKEILISGDNSRTDYDEPTAMKQALLALDVPESSIRLDYAGRRTLDSVVRARDVFQVRKMIVITQEYHACRALFLAAEHEVDAVAFAAAENVSDRTKFFNHAREYLARTAAWIDVKILKRKPHFPR